MTGNQRPLDISKQLTERLDIDIALQAAELGVWEVNLLTNQVLLDQRCCQLFGITSHQLSFSDTLHHIHPDDVERINQAIQWALNPQSDGNYQVSYRSIGQDGRTHWIRSTGRSYFDQRGQPIRLAGVSQELTHQVEAQQQEAAALQQSEARFRTLIEEAPVATCLFVGRQMVIDVANQAMIQVWGKGSDVIGLPLAEALPELKDQHFLTTLDELFTTGKTYQAKGGRADLVVAGKLQTFYFNYDFKPLRTPQGEVYAILETATDVTEQVLAQQRIEDSQQQLLTLFEQSPVGLATISASDELVFQWANSFYGELVARPPQDIVGKPLLDALPELKGQGFDEILKNVIATGKPFLAPEVAVGILRDGQLTTIYVDLTYQPQKGTQGAVEAILVVATDVTQQVLSRQKIEASETKLRGLIAAAPAGIGLFVGRDLIIENPNQTFIDIVGKGPGVEGLPLREAMPELLTEGQPFLSILDDVYTTGVPFISPASLVKIVQHGVLTDNYYNISYTPVYNAAGQVYAILDIAIDVTDQIKAQQALAHSEAHLQLLRDTVPAMIFYLDATQRYQSYNRVFMDWFKVSATEAIGKTVREFLGEQTYASVRPCLEQAYAGHQTRYELHAPTRMNTDRWLSIVYTPHQTEDGKVIGVIVLSTDITQQVLARQKAQESEESLRGAIELAAMGTWEWNMATGTITYSESLKRLFEFSQDFIDGDQVYNPIQEPDRARVAAAMERAAIPELGGLLDEEYGIITQQTSCRRIVRAQGKMYFDASGQPRKMLGSMRDVTEERALQLALEQQVQQRTEELAAANEELSATNEELAANNEEYEAINEELEEANNLLSRSNDNLQQFAYVASHDLQEPLRKIQQFGDLLKTHFTEAGDQEVSYLERIQSAAVRMSALIKDLLNYSRITAQRETNTDIALNTVIDDVLNDLELLLVETNARIEVDPLPVIDGDAGQLGQLFQNLLSNALKFRRSQVPPHIQIKLNQVAADQLPQEVKPGRAAKSYYQIEVIDNGVGFDEKYVDRIFQVFQRLHGKSEYAGTGIGLAICEKVVTNHGGAITARSQPGQGSTFTIYLPV